VLATLTSTDHGLTIFLSIGKKISTSTVAMRLQLFIRLVVVRFFKKRTDFEGLAHVRLILQALSSQKPTLYAITIPTANITQRLRVDGLI
jgi:hypothetical protein